MEYPLLEPDLMGAQSARSVPTDGWRATRTLLAAGLMGALSACFGEGVVTLPFPLSPEPEYPAAEGATLERGASGISWLSREEYASTVRALLGVDIGSDIELLPADSFTPFDNDYTLQVPSRALVEGLKAVAERAVAKVLADQGLRATLVGCAPTGPDDADCFGEFIRRFGRRALRRPLTSDEVEEYMALLSFARSSNDFDVAVGMATRAFLQDLEFVYRFEIGQPVRPGVVALTDWEMASRLSYFLWGRNPDDELLDLAEAGELQTRAGVRSAAERMLADERGRRRIERFHALWLGYERLPHVVELNAAMRQETDALIRRVVFEEDRSWLDLFTSTETYVNATLGQLYGLPDAPGQGFGWVSYPTDDRLGILSHGTLLSNGVKFGDTSPTLRGKFVRERLMCLPIPPPPDNVAADEPPPDTGGANCKYDRYEAHRAVASCAGCHKLMDGIGFGLENFDATGSYRAHDPEKPECQIAGAGEIPGIGMFRGPKELGQLLVESGRLETCLVERLYQAGLGRAPRSDDVSILEDLSTRFRDSGFRLRELVLDWVSSDAFRHRVIDES